MIPTSRIFNLMVLIFCALPAWSQSISGTILDREARFPLPGATVRLVSSVDQITASNIDGTFRLDSVPVGRHALQISFMGYEPRFIEGLVVTSGRPVVLEIEMVEM